MSIINKTQRDICASDECRSTLSRISNLRTVSLHFGTSRSPVYLWQKSRGSRGRSVVNRRLCHKNPKLPTRQRPSSRSCNSVTPTTWSHPDRPISRARPRRQDPARGGPSRLRRHGMKHVPARVWRSAGFKPVRQARARGIRCRSSPSEFPGSGRPSPVRNPILGSRPTLRAAGHDRLDNDRAWPPSVMSVR